MNKTKAFVTISSIACMTFHVHAQGDLAPSGAPAPTMKTLEQIESRTDAMTLPSSATADITITESGSYYLSDNLNVTNVIGIQIDASDVTLDLNGFKIARSEGPGGVGIQIEEESYRAKVFNGSIYGSFVDGINSIDSRSGRFEQLIVSYTLSYGFHTGNGSQIIECQANNNNGYGIIAGAGSMIRDCVAYNNKQTAIYAGTGSILSRCTAYGNKGTNVISSFCATVSECVAYNNDCEFAVISAFSGSTVSKCVVKDNKALYGINIGQSASVIDCTVNGNQVSYGIYANFGTLVSRCVVRSNVGDGTANYGIYAGGSCAISECTVQSTYNTNAVSTSSQGVGISGGSGSSIKDCVVTQNSGDGILVSYSSLVSGNTCYFNGSGTNDGAGIHATLSNNRIEDNNVTFADRGIDVDADGNLIIRNSASDNSVNYSIAANNKVGTIVNAPNSGAISGSTGGAGVGSTDPWANFSF